jgi:hypothetical protein
VSDVPARLDSASHADNSAKKASFTARLYSHDARLWHFSDLARCVTETAPGARAACRAGFFVARPRLRPRGGGFLMFAEKQEKTGKYRRQHSHAFPKRRKRNPAGRRVCMRSLEKAGRKLRRVLKSSSHSHPAR